MTKNFLISCSRCSSTFFSLMISGLSLKMCCMDCEMFLFVSITSDSIRDFRQRLEDIDKKMRQL